MNAQRVGQGKAECPPQENIIGVSSQRNNEFFELYFTPAVVLKRARAS